MSHPQQLFFVSGVKQFLPDFFTGKKVLEVGSLDLNGSVRQFFTDCAYEGLDVGTGPGVDTVCPGQDYGAPADAFDFVISSEMMEHNPAWRKTFLNMLRVLKPGGLMVLTCATTGRRQHGTTAYSPTDSPLTNEQGSDYYRNLTQSDIAGLVDLDSWFSTWHFYEDHTSHDLYFFGLALEASAADMQRGAELAGALSDYYFKRNILGLQ
ncbi:MAG: class I SAM-dependent methyltransferase [Comamonadaceae bacterium]|nr:class I SAM-dependent methyltransferase [Comamonadaceae bacterium]